MLRGGTVLILAVAACGGGEGDARSGPGPAAQPGAATPDVAVVPEAFFTPRDTLDNVDSPAVWHGPNGEHFLIVTAKEGDVLRVSDARTGASLRRVGGSGTALGAFERPNGVAVADDLVFVVERDNRRVQVLTLPDLRPLGAFGRDRLRRPYGLAVRPAPGAGARRTGDGAPPPADAADGTVRASGPAAYEIYVTDDYEEADDVVPADSLLGERVHRFRVEVGEAGGRAVRAEHLGAFGETEGRGVLHVVESVAVDPFHDRLLLAEEEEGDSKILVYTLDGTFTGREIPTRYFPHQAEGIVLRACPDGSGYWVTTDQGEEANTFHVFDRESLEHRGSFRGERVLNTDGIALTRMSYAGFPGGAFFAVHDDGNTVAFRWTDIASALDLERRCPPE